MNKYTVEVTFVFENVEAENEDEAEHIVDTALKNGQMWRYKMRKLFFKIWFYFNRGKPYLIENYCLYWFKEDWLVVKYGNPFSKNLYWGEDFKTAWDTLGKAGALDYLTSVEW